MTVIGVALEHVFCMDSSIDNALEIPDSDKAVPEDLLAEAHFFMTGEKA